MHSGSRYLFGDVYKVLLQSSTHTHLGWNGLKLEHFSIQNLVRKEMEVVKKTTVHNVFVVVPLDQTSRNIFNVLLALYLLIDSNVEL